MHNPNEPLAREMTAFCKQRSETRGRRPRHSAVARSVLGVVVAALLVPRIPTKPCWGHS